MLLLLLLLREQDEYSPDDAFTGAAVDLAPSRYSTCLQ
jgi:hypothetical protein